MNYEYAFPYINKDKVSLIFEIGSRDCNDAVTLQKKYECPVYAFECNPDGIVECDKTLRENKDLPIELIKMAVNSYDGVTSFFPFDPKNDPNIGASSLFHHKFVSNVQTHTTVACCRLDTFIKDKSLRAPDLLCMDIQGAELIALMSMGEYMRDIRYVATECQINGFYKDTYVFTDMYKFMEEQGFELVFSPYPRYNILKLLNEGERNYPEMETDFVWERI